jgi:plastocyanin
VCPFWCKVTVGAVTLAIIPQRAASAQSLLDRPPNLSGSWIVSPGTVQFNFLHRFMRSGAPIRKVSNFPTFVLAVGLPSRFIVGFYYATNSTLVPLYPNEWEFFGRIRPLSQDNGAPVDLGGQVGYNLAVRGLDGEVSLARRFGAVRAISVVRVLKNPDESGKAQVALGGGATLRLMRHLALAGDVASLTRRDPARGEKVAWSVGLHLAIPNTPHTLSLQASNANTATLEGASRGGDQVRYGFEFTIPFTLARYFGRRNPPTAPPTKTPAVEGQLFKTTMRHLAYTPSNIEVAAGTTITWKNEDQVSHTVTADDTSLDSGVIESDGSWSHLFDSSGTYTYHCTLHPFMKGKVVVR